MSRFWIWLRFSIYQNSQYTIILNIPEFKYTRLLNIPGFSIYQNSKYTRVLNGLWFSICKGSEYGSFTQSPRYAWIIPECALICLNMREYVRICVNMPKSAWSVSVFHVPIVIPCLIENVVTYFNEVCSLKEHETVEETKIDFFYSSWKYLICFCFRLYTFTGKISNLLLPFGAEGDKGHESW